MISFLRYHFKNFCRACAFFKEGYYNHDWDYAYLLDLMSFKLKRLEKEIRYGCASDREERANEIKYTLRILKRIQDPDYYPRIYEKQHIKKWGELNMKTISIEGSTNSQLIIEYEKAKTQKEKEQASLSLSEYMKKAYKKKKQDKERIFAYIANHIEDWWD